MLDLLEALRQRGVTLPAVTSMNRSGDPEIVTRIREPPFAIDGASAPECDQNRCLRRAAPTRR